MLEAFERRAAVLVLVSAAAAQGCGNYDPKIASGVGGGAATSTAGSGGTGGTSASAGSAGASNDGAMAGSSGAGGGGGGPAMSPASGCTMSEGGTAVTTLCADAPLNVLTPAEQSLLCSETGAYLAGAIDRAVGCKYVAMVASASSSTPTDAEMQAVCAAREMACNQDDSIMGAGALTQCSGVPASCTATVAQYTACVMDQAVVFEQGVAALTTCSMLTLGNLSALYDVPLAANEAAGCMALKMACPTYTLPYIN